MFLLRHIHLLTFLLDVFGKLAGALSVVTWVWVAILYVSCHSCIFNNFFTSNSLYYNRRPQSSNPLCRSYAHFISFLILSAVWIGRVYVNLCPTNGSDPRSIAIGIMIATQMPWECEAKMLWCAAACFSSALAFCTGFSGKFTSRYILGLYPSLILYPTALGACIIIYRAAAASGAGLAINIAQIHMRTTSASDFGPHQDY